MSPSSIFNDWLDTVKCLLPDLHGHTQKSLAALSFGLTQALHCHLSRAALGLGSSVPLPSVIRRFERLLANPRFSSPECACAVSRTILSAWDHCRIELLLDETPLSNRLRCLKVSVRYRGRALPLVWRCYAPDTPPLPLPQLACTLLWQVANLLPPHAEVILLADRGLSWPQVFDTVRLFGWHPLLRLQKDVRVRLSDGTIAPVIRLLEEGAVPFWQGEAEIFKDAGWRRTNLVLVWQESDPKNPWLLATTLPADRRACGLYRRRMRQEESFRDEKSYGFHWNQSRVWKPEHAERLLLGVALATLWIVSFGTQLVKNGGRMQLEPRKRRLYSIFGLGWRGMRKALNQGHPISCRLVFYPPPFKQPPPLL